MMHHLSTLLCLALAGAVASTKDNLAQNPGFEEDLSSTWKCYTGNCLTSQSTDAFTGLYSMLVTNRSQSNQGPYQHVDNIKAEGKYFYEARMKILNLPDDKKYGKIQLDVILRGASTKKKTVAVINYVKPCDGWIYLAGDFVTVKGTNRLSLQSAVSNSADINYLVDTVSLTEIATNPNWKEEADARIDKIRKGTITVRSTIKDPLIVKNMKLVIDQTKQSFPFGSAVSYQHITQTDAVSKRYQDYFYSMFNWAVITNAMKWRFMENTEGAPYFGTVDRIVDSLIANNMTNIRGHCISWAKEVKILSWLKGKDAKGVAAAVKDRISYMVEHYGKKIVHWDVNNEKLHGNWYEDATNNQQFTEGMFHTLHELNPDTTLMTNEYDALSQGMHTSGYMRQITQYIANGVPLGAAGLQSHLGIFPDMDLFKHRLDRMAETGVPLWITEFDLREDNETKRAQGMTDVLHLYFSHPSIEGIILWGFWDQSMEFPGSLVDGKYFAKRLDVLASVGSSFWITELDVRQENISARAIGYENVLRLYYSMPTIKGILFWGWDNVSMASKIASLADSPDYIDNEAGVRVRALIKNEWWTNLEQSLDGATSQSNEFRAFHGTHKISIVDNGVTLWSDTIELPRGKNVDISISLPL